MESQDVDASFRANRARMQRLAAPAALLECWWLCGQLLVLDGLRARAGLLVGVAAWFAWARWQLGPQDVTTWLPPRGLSRQARAVLLRSLALFVGSLVWQWATGRWLLSWHYVLRARGSGLAAVAWDRLFLMVVWVPLVEEVAFRAVMPRLLRARLPGISRLAVALLGGFVFSTYHLCNMVVGEQPAAYVAMQCVVALTAGCASALHVDACVRGTASDATPDAARLWDTWLVHVANNAIASVFRLAGHFDEPLVWVYFALANMSNGMWFRDGLTS